jgi:hypothetical protein
MNLAYAPLKAILISRFEKLFELMITYAYFRLSLARQNKFWGGF